MSSRTFARKLVQGLCLAAVAMPPAVAAGLQLQVERIDLGIASVEGLSITLDWAAGADQGKIEMTAARLDAPDVGYRYRDVRWRCSLTRKDADGLACRGALKARGETGGQLALDWRPERIEIGLQAKRGTLQITLGPDDSPTRIVLKALPVPWLQPLLAGAWKDGRITGGTLDAQLALERGAQLRLSGPVALHGLGLDSADGRIAAADLNLDGRIDYRARDAGIDLIAGLDVAGGEVLFGVFYASLPASGARLDLDIGSKGDSIWQVRQLHWRDPKVLDLELQARVASEAEPLLRELEARIVAPDMALVRTRYLDTVLATIGLPGLAMQGDVEGSVSARDGRLSKADLALRQCGARDSNGRFALADSRGTLRWTAGPDPLDSDLAWGSAAIHGITLGAAEVRLRSVSGGVALQQSVGIPALGGTIRLPRFSWQPERNGAGGDSLDLALGLERLQLEQLSIALGWPRFGGELSGEIPGVRYVDQVLQLDGGLAVKVFDGTLRVGALTLERPFGVAPTLTAEIDFAGLDLQPLTSAFGFGEITGRLDGYIHGLRLVDWTPVAFDADLHTSTTAKGRRRLSQRAVQDLSSVGGSGVAAGIQNQMLKLFDSFGYARIGLKCRLANNVCHMDGVDSSGDGYTIVEGSGLPRISVIGHQRKVDWPVLVSRLKAATDGQSPIVN